MSQSIKQLLQNIVFSYIGITDLSTLSNLVGWFNWLALDINSLPNFVSQLRLAKEVLIVILDNIEAISKISDDSKNALEAMLNERRLSLKTLEEIAKFLREPLVDLALDRLQNNISGFYKGEDGKKFWQELDKFISIEQFFGQLNELMVHSKKCSDGATKIVNQDTNNKADFDLLKLFKERKEEFVEIEKEFEKMRKSVGNVCQIIDNKFSYFFKFFEREFYLSFIGSLNDLVDCKNGIVKAEDAVKVDSIFKKLERNVTAFKEAVKGIPQGLEQDTNRTWVSDIMFKGIIQKIEGGVKIIREGLHGVEKKIGEICQQGQGYLQLSAVSARSYPSSPPKRKTNAKVDKATNYLLRNPMRLFKWAVKLQKLLGKEVIKNFVDLYPMRLFKRAIKLQKLLGKEVIKNFVDLLKNFFDEFSGALGNLNELVKKNKDIEKLLNSRGIGPETLKRMSNALQSNPVLCAISKALNNSEGDLGKLFKGEGAYKLWLSVLSLENHMGKFLPSSSSVFEKLGKKYADIKENEIEERGDDEQFDMSNHLLPKGTIDEIRPTFNQLREDWNWFNQSWINLFKVIFNKKIRKSLFAFIKDLANKVEQEGESQQIKITEDGREQLMQLFFHLLSLKGVFKKAPQKLSEAVDKAKRNSGWIGWIWKADILNVRNWATEKVVGKFCLKAEKHLDDLILPLHTCLLKVFDKVMLRHFDGNIEVKEYACKRGLGKALQKHEERVKQAVEIYSWMEKVITGLTLKIKKNHHFTRAEIASYEELLQQTLKHYEIQNLQPLCDESQTQKDLKLLKKVAEGLGLYLELEGFRLGVIPSGALEEMEADICKKLKENWSRIPRILGLTAEEEKQWRAIIGLPQGEDCIKNVLDIGQQNEAVSTQGWVSKTFWGAVGGAKSVIKACVGNKLWCGDEICQLHKKILNKVGELEKKLKEDKITLVAKLKKAQQEIVIENAKFNGEITKIEKYRRAKAGITNALREESVHKLQSLREAVLKSYRELTNWKIRLSIFFSRKETKESYCRVCNVMKILGGQQAPTTAAVVQNAQTIASKFEKEAQYLEESGVGKGMQRRFFKTAEKLNKKTEEFELQDLMPEQIRAVRTAQAA